MKTALISLSLTLLPFCSWAQSTTVEGVKIVNFGIYELEARKGSAYENSSWDVVRKVSRIQDTTTIPARLCVSFGFEYVIVGAPQGAEIPIKMVTKFPEPGLPNPVTGKRTLRSEVLIGRAIGPLNFRAYTFDKQWELMLGGWTFEIWHKDRMLAGQSFTVAADNVPPSTRICGQSPVSLDPAGFPADPRT